MEEKNRKKKKLTDREGDRQTDRQTEPLGDLRSPIYFALVNFN